MAYMDMSPTQQRFWPFEPWMEPGYTGPGPDDPGYAASRRALLPPPLGEGITPVGDPQATGTYFPGYGPGGKIAPSPFSPGQGAPGIPGAPGGAFNQYAQRGPFAGITDFQKLFYQDNPQTGYSDYLSFLEPNPNSAFYRYAASAYPRIYQNFLVASGKQPQLQWSDYLGGLGGQLGSEYGGLSPQARGEHPVQFSRWLA
jgi:hypothetical protein